MEWATLPLKRYAEFTGRSRRKEYWSYILLIVVLGIVINVVEGILGLSNMVGPYGPISALLALGTFIPTLAAGIRRLHDTDRSGWWLLVGYGPLAVALALLVAGNLQFGMMILGVAGIGFLVLLVLMVIEGTRGDNQYGPDPKRVEGAPAAA
jgi:uncharacterized membrane protein YhaH (DUF805 family)